MKRLILSAAMLAMGATSALADANGLWRTQPNDKGDYLVVEIGPCADKTCGVIVAARSEAGVENADYPNLGRNIITDMEADGPNKWDNGEIWAPDEDKTYNSNMELNGDILSVEGCVLFICRGQDWTRDQ